MDETTEQKIRERAYALWEKEGSPPGRAEEFWERARLMIEADVEPPPTTPLQQRSAAERVQDKVLEDSFPASDPPSSTQPARGRKAKG